MYVIAGLGNPGTKYAKTRHNCGFDAVDILADRLGVTSWSQKFSGMVAQTIIAGEKVLLVKPLTYMNLSGQCLQQVCDFYKIDPEESLIVISDDISLAPGALRVKTKGSAGGHNGLKNIIACLGTDKFKRVRVGVGEKPAGWDLADYVLGHVAQEDKPAMEEALEKASQAAEALISEDPQKVQTKFNISVKKAEQE